MYEQFKEKAQAVGAEVHRFPTMDDALDFLLAYLREAGVADAPGAYAVWAEGPFRSGISRERCAALPGLRFDVTRENMANALVGVSELDWALADTGTLVGDQSAVEQRLVSSLPSVHVALVATGAILPDKEALFSRIDPRRSRFIAFITGPSRTADIERVLTIGVHGPKKLVIVMVDEAAGGTL